MTSTGEALPITVVIPVYRRADLVARAVKSALAQQPPPAEVIVVDDCSDDDSGAVAAAAGATVVRLAVNSGLGAARNAGVRHASNDWIALLDSDDAWLPTHLATLWANRGDHVLVGAAGRGSVDGRVFGHPGPRPKVFRYPSQIVLPYNRVTPSGAMLHRPALDAAGGFRTVRLVEDLDAWVRILEHGTGVALPQVTFEYHQHPVQMSADLGAMSRALDEIVGGYAARPWCTDRVIKAAQAMPRWDQARAALRRRDRQGATKLLVSLLHPWRLLGLCHLLTLRRRSARRAEPTGN
jgi:glycosyltransferase involved in cell wall biosynthesis